jgi:hypothetical protein
VNLKYIDPEASPEEQEEQDAWLADLAAVQRTSKEMQTTN